MTNKLMQKSVAMANELDVAGEFIYVTLEKINRMSNYTQVADDFFILYHLAVGIERMQKILLVIINDISDANVNNFLKEIKHHKHNQLQEKINKKCKICFSKEQNNMLNLLSDFYNGERYERFDFIHYDFKDKNMLINFITNNCPNVNSDKISWQPFCYNTDNVKEFLGRIIGKIGQKYYNAIEDESRKRNIYCYELRHDSMAEKLFLGSENKDSYQKKIDNEELAIKELLLYLINPQENNEFMNYLDNLESLPFDVALIQDYVADLCNKIVSQELIDEVDCLYEDMEVNFKERKNELDIIGNRFVIFDLDDNEQCLFSQK